MTSHSSDQKTSGPIPAFDHQLKTLGDSYIAFMQERVRIEEAYVDALSRLHRNTRALDNLLDDQDPSSVRVAWRELRDNIEREAETRSAFANTLKMDVLPPLHALRETQERTRKRIREDLKESTLAHQDYVENTLPRLKRHYLKKCQEVEEYKSADRPTVSTTAANAAPNPVTFDAAASPSPRRASFGDRERVALPNVASPTPSHPSTASQAGSRNRSPTTTGTAFSDLAHQGKKGLNQLIGFLDQNRERSGTANSVRESTERANNGLRGIRAKREADEADKEYRKGVHWLETLRLRRVKILQAGYNSLESFVSESGDVMSKALEAYVNCVISTTSTCASLASYAQSTISKISTKTDLERVHSFVAYAFPRATPPQLFYWNYHVGECRDLIFGVSLVDYATARSMNNEAPSLVMKCIREVESRGLDAEGIYRVSGRHAVVQELTHKIERNERAFQFNPMTEDVYAVSGLLKLYLRELPEPVFRFPLSERLQHTEDREEHINNGFLLLKSKIRRLPPVHQATLRVLVEHLGRVAANAPQNKMDARNLAIVFGSVVFGEDEVPKTGDILSITAWRDTVMEDLITYGGLLFDDLHHPSRVPSSGSASANESPLPILPPETPLNVEHGSSFTRVTTLPPRAQSSSRDQDFTPSLPPRPPYAGRDQDSSSPFPPRSQYLGKDQGSTPSLPSRAPYSSRDQDFTLTPASRQQSSSKDQDFTPNLPPRPQNSIHPSRRVATNSSSLDPVAADDTSLSSQRRPSNPIEDDSDDTTTPYGEQLDARQQFPELSDPFQARETKRLSKTSVMSVPPSPAKLSHAM